MALQKQKEDEPLSLRGSRLGLRDLSLVKVTVDTAAQEDLQDFHLGALWAGGDHLNLSDHSGMNPLRGG